MNNSDFGKLLKLTGDFIAGAVEAMTDPDPGPKENRSSYPRQGETGKLAEALWIAHEKAVRGDGQAGPFSEALSHHYKFYAMAETILAEGYRKTI